MRNFFLILVVILTAAAAAGCSHPTTDDSASQAALWRPNQPPPASYIAFAKKMQSEGAPKTWGSAPGTPPASAAGKN